MSTSLVLVIKTTHTAPANLLGGNSTSHASVRNLANFLEACLGGNESASIDAHTSTVAPVAASNTVTCASVADADTVTIGGTVLTAKTSPSGAAQWARGGTDTADAAALAACVNAHTTLNKVFAATSALGVVTLTCLQKGSFGNFVAVTSTGGTMAVATALMTGGTGGANAAAKTYRLGL